MRESNNRVEYPKCKHCGHFHCAWGSADYGWNLECNPNDYKCNFKYSDSYSENTGELIRVGRYCECHQLPDYGDAIVGDKFMTFGKAIQAQIKARMLQLERDIPINQLKSWLKKYALEILEEVEK